MLGQSRGRIVIFAEAELVQFANVIGREVEFARKESFEECAELIEKREVSGGMMNRSRAGDRSRRISAQL